MYRLLFSLVIARVPAETVHHLTIRGLRALQAVPGAAPLLRRLLVPRDPALAVRAFGLDFPSPLGLAAGFDKDAVAYEALGAFGFGHVEIGTVTGRPQPGNPRPGCSASPPTGRSSTGWGSTTRAPGRRPPPRGTVRPDDRRRQHRQDQGRARASAAADYVASTERLAPHADYLVVNVSSPNTPGLRNLQAVEHLRPLLTAVREAADRSSPRRVPCWSRSRRTWRTTTSTRSPTSPSTSASTASSRPTPPSAATPCSARPRWSRRWAGCPAHR